MTIYWPENLPLPIKYGAETEFSKGNKISTDFDYGPIKSRRRFTNSPAYQTIEISLSDVQYDQFLNFYSTILLAGVVSFYANVISGIGIESKRCKIKDDSLKVNHETFNRHTISLVLEIYNPMPYSNNSGTSWLIAIYGPDFVVDVLADPLHYEIHTHYPAIMENY